MIPVSALLKRHLFSQRHCLIRMPNADLGVLGDSPEIGSNCAAFRAAGRSRDTNLKHHCKNEAPSFHSFQFFWSAVGGPVRKSVSVGQNRYIMEECKAHRPGGGVENGGKEGREAVGRREEPPSFQLPTFLLPTPCNFLILPFYFFGFVISPAALQIESISGLLTRITKPKRTEESCVIG